MTSVKIKTLPLPYFGNILFYSTLFNNKTIVDVHENYPKQTLRNRCEIVTDQGLLKLSVPVKKSINGKQTVTDTKIDNRESWQKDHEKSIRSAYSSSPFYEFYIDDIKAIWTKNYSSLVQLNLDTHSIICKIMEWDLKLDLSTQYIDSNDYDLRPMFGKSNRQNSFKPYTQVFLEKKVYLSNMSILDLIFNLGPEASSYLVNTTS